MDFAIWETDKILVVVVKRSYSKRIGGVKFRQNGELLLRNRFPLKMKGKAYRCCVRSAILYGSEAWRL